MNDRANKRRRVSSPGPQSHGMVRSESDPLARNAALGDNTYTSGSNADSTLPQESIHKIRNNGDGKNHASAIKSRRSPLTVDATSLTSVFKFRTGRLLQSLCPARDEVEQAAVEDTLRSLKVVIENIPRRSPMTIDQAEKGLLKSHKIAIPFPSPRPSIESNLKLSYDKPSNINVVGSYACHTATNDTSELIIDLVLTIPESEFTEKDYKDYRYFYKRAFYLACIAAGLQEAQDCDYKFCFTAHNDNHLLPVLNVQAKTLDSDFGRSRCQINILPAINRDFFPRMKILPGNNCIRSKDPQPTPFYNATLSHDASITSFLKAFHRCNATCEGYRHACVLGRIWLRQRGLASAVSKGGFGNFEWSALMANLLLEDADGRRVLSTTYDSHQLFRATLQFIASKDLAKQPLAIGSGTIPSHLRNHCPILFDSIRNINLLFKMTPSSYRLLFQEAQVSIRTLGGNAQDSFESTFILKPSEPCMRYDIFFRIYPGSSKSMQDAASGAPPIMTRSQNLHSVLKRGLGNRLRLLDATIPPMNSWPTNNKTPSERFHDPLSFSISLNPEHAGRGVDRGPAPEKKEEVDSFRQLWGNRAELRRFKDGEIVESVVWASKEPIPIMKEIITHLIQTHLDPAIAKNIAFVETGSSTDLSNLELNTHTFQQISLAYKNLERAIRTLQDLPLVVEQIRPASPYICGTTLDVPVVNSRTDMAPADVVIKFESSSRWPDDLSAIQMTKVAFLIKLRESISKSLAGSSGRIGIENEHSEILNRSFLDIILSSGPVFRIRIHHERERTLIERRLADKTIAPREREAAGFALSQYRITFEQYPQHTQAIQTLSTRFPALTPTIRAVKKWFHAHLLAPHFAEPLIELFVLRTFLNPQPWSSPSSAQTGLFRTLLFLSRWDWHSEPWIVDLNGSLKDHTLTALITRFEAWRHIDPLLNRVALFTASSADPDGTTWSLGRPSKVISARLTSLTRAAAQHLSTSGPAPDVSALFISPLLDYDFVIHLHRRFTNVVRSAKSRYKNVALETARRDDAMLKATRSYFTELETLYHDSVVFFYDLSGGAAIAGSWTAYTQRRAWKVNLGFSTMPVAAQDGVEDAALNKDSMLAEMARLGGDMVSRIEINR